MPSIKVAVEEIADLNSTMLIGIIKTMIPKSLRPSWRTDIHQLSVDEFSADIRIPTRQMVCANSVHE
jgi:hypothetical protein